MNLLVSVASETSTRPRPHWSALPLVGGSLLVTSLHLTASSPGSYGKNRDLAVPFWSTKDAGQKPFTFVIGRGNVIKAWDEGVLGAGRSLLARSLLSEPRNAGMTLGEQAKITATPDYAYGAGGFPAWGIMPNRRETAPHRLAILTSGTFSARSSSTSRC